MEILIIITTVVMLLTFLKDARGSESEKGLVQYLLKDYNKLVRPVGKPKDRLYVKVGMSYNHIIDLDERNQVLHSSVWMRMEWVDYHLKWNQTDFGEISDIVLPSTYLWRPDIVLYNSVYKFGYNDFDHTVIFSNGRVQWLFPAILKSSCPIDVTYFPFDQQKCLFEWGSWVYHGDLLYPVNSSVAGDVDNFILHGEWELIDMPVETVVKYYNCCPQPYPLVKFTVRLQRKPLYYMFNLVFPAVMINIMSLLAFLLPPESGEKVSLSVTVLLTLTVFMLVISESMPPTSESIPLIGRYFAAVLILMSLTCTVTVIVLNLHHKEAHGRRPPLWLRKLLLEKIGRLVLVKYKCEESQVFDAHHKNLTGHGTNRVEGSCVNFKVEGNNTQNTVLNDHINIVEDNKCRREWVLIAFVVDRVCLVIFLVSVIVVAASMLSGHPGALEKTVS